MKAKSIKGNSQLEIMNALAGSMADGFTPTLAVMFISIRQDRDAICELLRNAEIDVIGATSSGEFIEGQQSEGGIVILLLDIHKEGYSILFEDIGERTLPDAATHLATCALKKFKKPAFILCSTSFTADGKMLDGATLIASIENTAGPETNIFGGMAGDDISFTGTFVFTVDESTEYGIVALVLDEDQVELHGMAISGWKPIGLHKKVTKSEGNLVYTIDSESAISVYMRFLGEAISSADDQVKFFDSIGVHYPIQMDRENRAPMLNTPIGYNKDKDALVFESDVPQGSRFRFSTPPDFDIIETVVGKAKDLKNEIQTDAEALLIFSCAGRLSALGPMAHEENEGLHGVWNVPMAGFYTYGEFGRALNGKHEFHSTTCSWVALKEK